MSAPTLELWQTEWCPASHRVRQRLTELGLTYTSCQLPVERDARTELQAVTGVSEIPVLIAGSDTVRGERAILAYLDGHFIEPPDAADQRGKATKPRERNWRRHAPS